MTAHEENQLYLTITEVTANLEKVEQGRALLAKALQEMCRELLDQKAIIALLNESMRNKDQLLEKLTDDITRANCLLDQHVNASLDFAH